MPSLNSVWIPTISVAYVLAFSFLLYAWEHMYGTVTRFVGGNSKKGKAVDEDVQEEFDLESKKEKKKRHKRQQADQVEFNPDHDAAAWFSFYFHT